MTDQPKPIQYETKIVEYKNARALKKGTERMARDGWQVISITNVDQGYSAGKTCCLGCLFLPLALLGKKPQIRQVLYQREIEPEE